MTAALQTEKLCVAFAGRRILTNITISVQPGEVVGILGPNGAGKSTLIKSILGLVPASSGTITLDGRPASKLRPAERARLAAYVPQEREVSWALTVEAIVALGRLPHRPAFASSTTTDRTAIREAMNEADITELGDRPITELSGGERARVLIARALVQEVPLLLADEPTSGLDPAHQLALLALLRSKAAAGRTVVFSIHELHLAARWCDRLILLHEGRLADIGSPETVLTRKNMLSVYGCDTHIAHTPDGPVMVPIPIRQEDLAAHANT